MSIKLWFRKSFNSLPDQYLCKIAVMILFLIISMVVLLKLMILYFFFHPDFNINFKKKWYLKLTTYYVWFVVENNYILIYVACTGALALLITFAVLGRQKQRRLMLKQMKLSANRSIRLHEQNVQEDHEIINDSDRMNDTV